MTKKQNPKARHHYVPQFYLRHFTTPPEHKYLSSLKKSDGGSFSGTLPKKLAVENPFYTVNGDPSFEDELEELEKEWSRIHNKLVDQKTLVAISDNERRKYAEFIGYQLSRTARFRNWLMKASQLAFSDLFSGNPSEEHRKTISSQTGTIAHILTTFNVEALVDEVWSETSGESRRDLTKEELIEIVQGAIDEKKGELARACDTGVLAKSLYPTPEQIDGKLSAEVKISI